MRACTLRHRCQSESLCCSALWRFTPYSCSLVLLAVCLAVCPLASSIWHTPELVMTLSPVAVNRSRTANRKGKSKTQTKQKILQKDGDSDQNNTWTSSSWGYSHTCRIWKKVPLLWRCGSPDLLWVVRGKVCLVVDSLGRGIVRLFRCKMLEPFREQNSGCFCPCSVVKVCVSTFSGTHRATQPHGSRNNGAVEALTLLEGCVSQGTEGCKSTALHANQKNVRSVFVCEACSACQAICSTLCCHLLHVQYMVF